MKRRAAKPTSPQEQPGKKVVIIGSYREDLPGLLAFSDLVRSRGCVVLHPPPQAQRVGESSGFVRLDCDPSPDEGHVQRAVLAQIDRADAVLLYNPSGRIGISAALEVGYCLRAHKPVLALTAPVDVTIRSLIHYGPAALREILGGQIQSIQEDHAPHSIG